MAKEVAGELKGVAAIQSTAEQTPPGGASDSHRHRFKSLLDNPYLGVMPFNKFPPGSLAMHGKFGFDQTNHRVIWYEGASRYGAPVGAIV